MMRIDLLFFFVLLLGVQGDFAPVFISDFQDNQSFPLAPGQLLNLSDMIKIYDADSNGTSAGSIVSTADFVQTSLFCVTRSGENEFSLVTCGFTGFNIQASMSLSEGFTNRSSIAFSIQLQPSGSYDTVPSPMVRACFQARDGVGKTSSMCINIFLLVPPRPVLTNDECLNLFVNSSWYFSDYSQPCLIDSLSQSSAVGLGQTLVRNVYFSSSMSYVSLNVDVSPNPGLPNGMSVTETKGGASDSAVPLVYSNKLEFDLLPNKFPKHQQYVFSRRVTFTPSEDQIGLTYQLCFSSSTYFNQQTVLSTSYQLPNTSSWPQLSVANCLSVSVVPPSFALNSTDLNLSAAAYHDVLVGCDYVWSIVVYEPSRYVGAASLLLQTNYTPVLVADPLSPLPPSASFSGGQRLVVCSDRQDRVCANKTYPVTRFELRWRPSRGLEAMRYQSCFWLQERSFPSYNRIRFCANFRVVKCRTCVMGSETLLGIAREYRTTWQQLWGANPTLENPHDLSQLSFLHLGPSFHVSKDTDATVIMQRFGMRQDAFKLVNPELNRSLIPRDSDVCVLTAMCRQNTDNFFA